MTTTNASPLRDARRASRRASRSAIASSGVRGDKQRTRGSLLAVLFLLLKEFLLNEIAAAIVARLESGRQREGEGWREKKARTHFRARGTMRRGGREGRWVGVASLAVVRADTGQYFSRCVRLSAPPPLARATASSESVGTARSSQLAPAAALALGHRFHKNFAEAKTALGLRQKWPSLSLLSCAKTMEFDRWNSTQVRKVHQSQFTTCFPKPHFLAELKVGC